MCFAIRRGEAERLDPKFIIHGGHQALRGVRTAKLGSLTLQEPDYGGPYRAVPREGDGFKYIRVTDFDDFGIPDGHSYVGADGFDPRYVLQDGDLLFARSGATAGKTFMYTRDIGPAIFAGYCIRFRFDSARVLPGFVYLYTKTDRYQAWVRSMQRPSGQPNINKEEFKSFTIPLPDPPKQRALLDALDAARVARRRKLEEADSLLGGLDAVVRDILGITLPPVDAHRTTYAVRLTDVREGKKLYPDYFHPERLNAIRAVESRYTGDRCATLLTIADFRRDQRQVQPNDSYLGLANVQPNTGERVESSEEDGEGTVVEYAENDVLFARLRPYLNKVYRAEKAGVCSPEFHVMRVRLGANGEPRVLPDYLAAVLRSGIVLSQTRHMMTGNTHPRLANDDVVNLVVPVPDPTTQKEIADEVACRRDAARRQRDAAAALWERAKAHFEISLLGPPPSIRDGRGRR